MRVAVLGASGFIGRHLTAALRARGDRVVEASLRDPEAAARASSGCDAVVNLAGAPVAARWTASAKRAMWSSRVDVPRAFLRALEPLDARPATYISASAIGYYGTSRDATFVEESLPGGDFLANLCVAWEAETDTAAALGMRVTKVRTGLVLGRDGGVLVRLVPLFRAGLGGPVASGRQWYSWIALEDLIGIYAHALDGTAGVLNATAPDPVTNREFTRALGGALHRPTPFPVPAFAVAALLGAGASIVTEGQRVLPARTLATGYVFRHPQLGAALEATFKAAAPA
jgi:uncharacterized protein (TIGR01777 family)